MAAALLGAVVVTEVVEVVELSVLSPLEPHAAVIALRAIAAAASPAVTGKRRAIRLSVMVSTRFCVRQPGNHSLARSIYPPRFNVKHKPCSAARMSQRRESQTLARGPNRTGVDTLLGTAFGPLRRPHRR